jgi:hypothetical protein
MTLRNIVLIRKLILYLALSALCDASIAATFIYTNINPFSNEKTTNTYLYMSGEFIDGDAQKLRKLVSSDVGKFVSSPIVIDSNGGNVLEALKIARLVNSSYAIIALPRKAKCASSCFFILTAASKRYMEGKVGIHRPYLPKSVADKMNIIEMESSQKDVYKRSSDILKEHNVPQYLIDKMVNSASTEIYWLSDKDKKALGFRPPWYEQMLISKCGLDKKLEEKFFETNDQKLFNKMQAAKDCEAEIVTDFAYERTLKLVEQGF